jgi:hypothetical protein
MYHETTREAVAEFQSFYRLPNEEEGIAGSETLAFLSQKRCGVVDLTPRHAQNGLPLSPYVTVGAKWQKAMPLTYRFLNTSPDLNEARQQAIIKDAFARWQAVSGLSFEESPQGWSTDVSIAFHPGSHGDGNAFDDQRGPGGKTLAHAFFPPPAGGPRSPGPAPRRR